MFLEIKRNQTQYTTRAMSSVQILILKSKKVKIVNFGFFENVINFGKF